MRGSEPYQRCSCRDPVTRKPLGKRCPKLKAKGHALGWFYRYDAPRAPGESRRQPEIGPFKTKKEADEDRAATLARIGAGGQRAGQVAAHGHLPGHLARSQEA